MHPHAPSVSTLQHYAARHSTPSKSDAQPAGMSTKPGAADITFTATTSAYGSLLIGSSREFVDSLGPESTQVRFGKFADTPV